MNIYRGMLRILVKLSVSVLITVLVSGCATNPTLSKLTDSISTGMGTIGKSVKNTFDSDDPCSNNARNIGIAVGTLGGIFLGNQIQHSTEARLGGAAIGAGLGALIGHDMDSRRCALYKIAQENNLKLISASITAAKLGQEPDKNNKDANMSVGLDVQVQNQSSEFVGNTAVLTPEAQKYIGQIADQYKPKTITAPLGSNTSKQEVQQAKDRKVLIIGHASESDDPVAAAKLSENRAEAVAKIFARHGVPTKNIYYQGAGDTLPIANNATEQGKAENQRIQIVDMSTEADIRKYTQFRAPNPANFTTVLNNQDAPKQKKEKRDTILTPSDLSSALTKTPSVSDTHALAFDFGGKPTQDADQSIDLGDTVEHSMFNLVSSAHADAPFLVGSCTKDQPHSSTDIRNLSSGKVLPVRDYLPGFYGASWVSGVNGNLVSLIDVKVPVDAGSPIDNPELYIYKNYTGNAHQKPSFNETVKVNVYRGSKSTLYRVFVRGPMKCMDLVVKNGEPQGSGYVLYDVKTALYEASSRFVKR